MAVDLGSAVGRIIINGADAAKGIETATGALLKLESTGVGIAGSIAKAGTAMALVAGTITAGLGVGIGYAVNQAANFEQQMQNVVAISGASGKSLEDLRQTFLDLGQSTIFNANQVAQAAQELVKGGITVEEVLGGALAGTLSLAAAGSLDLAEAATVASVAINTFNLEGGQMEHVADLLANGANASAIEVRDLALSLRQSGQVANQFGLSIDETIGILSAFGAEGLKASDAGTSLRTFLLSTVNPTKKAQKVMEEYGISFHDTAGNMKSMDQIAQNLQDSLSGLTQEQRNAALETIFGRDAIRAASILMQEGAAGVNKWVTEVGKVGEANRVAGERMNSLRGDVEQMQGAFQTLLINTGSAFIPVTRGVVQFVTDVVQAFNNSRTAAAAFDKISKATLAGLQKLRDIGKPLSQALGQIFSGFRTGDFNFAFGPLVESMEAAFGSRRIGMIVTWASGVLRAFQLVRDGFLTFQQALAGNWFGGQNKDINIFVRAIGRGTQLARDAILTIRQAAEGNWFGGADEGIQPVVRALGRMTQLIRDAAITAEQAFKGEWIDSDVIAQPVRLIGQLVDGVRLAISIFRDTKNIQFIDVDKLSPVQAFFVNFASYLQQKLIPALKDLGKALGPAGRDFAKVFTPERVQILRNFAKAILDTRMDILVAAIKALTVVLPAAIRFLALLTAGIIDFIGWVQDTPAASLAFRVALLALFGVIATNKMVDLASSIATVTRNLYSAATAAKAWNQGLLRGPRAVTTVVTTVFKTVGRAAAVVGGAVTQTISFVFANAQSAAIWAQLYAQQYGKPIVRTVITTFKNIGTYVTIVSSTVVRTVQTVFTTVGQFVNYVTSTVIRTVQTVFTTTGSYIADIPATVTRTVQTVYAALPSPPSLPPIKQVIEWVIPPFPDIKPPSIKINITLDPSTLLKGGIVSAIGGAAAAIGGAITAAIVGAISVEVIVAALLVVLAAAVTAAIAFITIKGALLAVSFVQSIASSIQAQGGLGPALYNLFARAIPYALGQLAGLLVNGGLILITFILNGMARGIPALIGFIRSHFQEIIGILLLIFGGLPGQLIVFFVQFQGQIIGVIGGILSVFGTLVAGITGFVVQIGAAFLNLGLSIFTAISNAMVQVQVAFATAFININTAILTFILGIVTAFVSLAGQILTVLTTLGTSLLTAFGTAFQGVLTAIGTFITAIKTAFSQLLSGDILGAIGTVLSGIGTLFSNLVSVAVNFASQVATAFSSAFSGILGAVGGFIGEVISAFIQLGSSIVSAVQGGISSIISAFLSLGSGIVSAVSSAFSSVLSAVTSAMSAIQTTISSAWEAVSNAVTSAVTAIGTFLSTAWSSFVAGFQSTFSGPLLSEAENAMNNFKNAVSNGINEVVNFFSQLSGKITSTLSGLAGALFGIGKDAIQGLINGIQSAAGGVAKAVQDIINSIPGGIRDILDMHSPSKLLESMGSDAILGFIIGMSSEEQEAIKTASDVAKGVADAIKAGVEAMEALNNFEATGVAAIRSFAKSMNDAIEEFSNNMASVADDNKEAIESYAKIIRSIADAVKAGAEISQSLAEFVEPQVDAIRRFVESTIEIVNQFAEAASSMEEGMLDDAGRWVAAVSATSAAVAKGAEGFTELAGALIPTAKRIKLFVDATIQMVQQFAEASDLVSGELIEKATEWAAAIGAVTSTIADGAEAMAAIVKFVAPTREVVGKFRDAMLWIVTAFAEAQDAVGEDLVDRAAKFAKSAQSVIDIVESGVKALSLLSGFRRPTDKAIGDFKFAIEHLVRSFADTEVFLGSEFYERAVAFVEAAQKVIDVVESGVMALALINSFVRPSDFKIGEFKFAIEHLVRSFGDTAVYLGSELPEAAAQFAEAAQKVIDLVISGVRALAMIAFFVRPSNTKIGEFKFAVEHLVRSFADTAQVVDGGMVAAAAAFAEGAGKVLELIAVGTKALSQLFFFTAPPAAQVAKLRNSIIDIVEAFGQAALSVGSLANIAGEFSDNAQKVLTLVGDAIGTIARIGRGVTAPDPAAILRLATTIGLVVRAIGIAAVAMAAGTVQIAAEFAEGAGKVVTLINEATSAFSKLRIFRVVDQGAINAFVTSITGLVQGIANAASNMDLTGLSAAQTFSESAQSIVDLISSGVEALNAIADGGAVAVPTENMQGFANALARLVEAVFDASFSIDAGVANAASAFAESVQGVVDLIGSGVEALNGLADFTPPSDAQINALKAAIILTVNKIIEASQQIDSSLVEAAAQFSESAGKVVGLISSATSALTQDVDDKGQVKGRVIVGADFIVGIVNAIGFAVNKMVELMRQYPTSLTGQLAKFSDDVAKAMSALDAASKTLAPQEKKEGEVDPTARIGELIAKLNAGLPGLQTLNAVAQQYKSEMVKAAAAIAEGFLAISTALEPFGDAALINAVTNGGDITIESHVLIERKTDITFRMMDENGPWIVRSLQDDVVSRDRVIDMVVEGLDEAAEAEGVGVSG